METSAALTDIRTTWATVTPEQYTAIKSVVAYRRVIDVGAGDLTLARELVTMGAELVLAIEPHLPRSTEFNRGRYRLAVLDGYLHDALRFLSVTWPCLLLSWPQPIRGLVEAAKSAYIVIYLGKNTEGCQCGGAELFSYLSTREVLAHVADRRNTLIIYGPTSVTNRQPLPEEIAATDTSFVHPYSET